MGARDTYAWKLARARAKRGARVCAICHQELDFKAPPRSRWAPSVDHIVPLSRGGKPFDPANLRVVHYGCNSARGAGRQPKRRSLAKAIRANWW